MAYLQTTMKQFCILVGCIGIAIGSLAQSSTPLELNDDAHGRQAIVDYYNQLLQTSSQASGVTAMQKLSAHYQQQKMPMLEQTAWLYWQLLQSQYATSLEQKQNVLYQAQKQAAKKNWPAVEAELQLHTGLNYFEAGQKGPGFENMLRAFGSMEQLGFDQYPWLGTYSVVLGNSYFALGDMESTVRYAPVFENVPPNWYPEQKRYHFRNTIGLAYRHLEKLDSAALFFQKAYKSAQLNADTFWMALAHGNLAAVYYQQKRYAEAIPFLATDYTQSKRFGEWGSMLNAGIMWADCLLKINQVAEAKKIAGALDSAANSSTSFSVRKSWFKLQYDLAKLDGRQEAAIRFADSAMLYQNKMVDNRNTTLINTTRNKLEMESYLHSIEKLEQQKKFQVLLRNSLLVMIVLGAVIALLLINRSRIRRAKRLAKLEYEKQLGEEKLQQITQELDQYTLRMKEKTALLDRFEQEIETLKSAGMAQTSQADKAMQELLQSSILTESEWLDFRELFEKVHPGFMSRLRVKMPDLTPAETRLLVLTKLQLSNKEMGAMLGIGYDAIKKTRQRLRKKIELPEEGSLEDLIALI
jgi:tetratricopeptide (TPR) repeat protein